MAANKTLRWLTLLDILFENALGLTTSQLVDKLNERELPNPADLRNVQRDLKEISECGIAPLFCSDEIPRRWKLDSTKLTLFTKRFALTPEAAVTVKLAIEHMEMLLPPAAYSTLLASKEDIERSLARFAQLGRRPWTDKLRVLPYGDRGSALVVSPGIRATLYDALLQERRVRITYKRAGTSGSEIEIYDPMGMIVGSTRLQLVAQKDGLPLILEMHNIEEAEGLAERAHGIADFDLDAFIAQTNAPEPMAANEMTTEHEPLRLLVTDALKDYWELSPLSPDQSIRQHGDRWLVESSKPVDGMLRRFLFAQGADVTVLSPARVRQKLANEARMMLERYCVEVEGAHAIQ